MTRFSTRFIVALLLVVFAAGFTSKTGKPAGYPTIKDMVLIAHAGGGLPQGRYSNSLEAFDLSSKNGHLLIETDLEWTKNGALVLLHDWEKRYHQYFTRFPFMAPTFAKILPRKILTRSEFMGLEMNHGLHQMDLDRLLDWMKRHPRLRIVTDIKENNLKALARIKHKAGPLINQFIPQIYAPEEYQAVKALGFNNIIFTAYNSDLDDQGLADLAARNKLFALTVPAKQASAKLVRSLAAHNTPVFAHTLNSPKIGEILKKRGIAGLYTDYLIPGSKIAGK